MTTSSRQPDLTARYIRADIYKYSDHAAESIKRQFESKIDSIGVSKDVVSLHYVLRTNAFHLQCPSDQGSVLDGFLGDILAQFRQLDSARSIESRVLKPFQDSIFLPYDPLATTHFDVEHESSTVSNKPSRPVTVLHDQGNTRSGKAKPWFLEDLVIDHDQGLRKHYITVLKRAGILFSQSDVRIILAAKFDDEEDEWKLSAPKIDSKLGRVDREIRSQLMSPLQLNAPQRPSDDPTAVDEEQKWRWIKKPSNVRQWIEGMGETALDRPDEASPVQMTEVLPQTLKTRDNNIGRLRMAMAENSKPMSSSGTAKPDTCDSDEESSNDSLDEPIDVRAILVQRNQKQQIGAKLNNGNQAALQKQTMPCQGANKSTPHRSTGFSMNNLPSSGQSQSMKATPTSQVLEPTATRNEIKLPSTMSDKSKVSVECRSLKASSAKVDRHGLIGRPELQARYDLETMGRAHQSDTCSATAQPDAQRDLWDSYDSSAQPSGVAPAWENTIVRDNPIKTGILVDTSIPPHQQWPKLPEQSAIEHAIDTGRPPIMAAEGSTYHSPGQTQSVQKDIQYLDESSDDLIDLESSTEWFSAHSTSPPPSDVPLDRLNDDPEPEPAIRKHTMRQKAGKKWNKPHKYEYMLRRHNCVPAQPSAAEATRSQLQVLGTQLTGKSAITTIEGSATNFNTNHTSHGQSLYPREPLAAFLQSAIEQKRSTLANVLIKFGIALTPWHSDSPEHAVDNGSTTFEELETALALDQDSTTSRVQFVPQILRVADCAALYTEVLSSVSNERDSELPPPITKIKIVLTTHDGTSVELWLDWDRCGSVNRASISMLHANSTVVCPRHLWDLELVHHRRVQADGTPLDDQLIDFAMSIAIKDHGTGWASKGMKAFEADIPQHNGKPAFAITSVSLVKVFEKVLKSSELASQAAAKGFSIAWIMTQTLPLDIVPGDTTSRHLTAIGLSEEHLELEHRSSWQSYLSLSPHDHAAPPSASQNDLSWFETFGRILLTSMNKVYYGTILKTEVAKPRERHRGRQKEPRW